MPCKEEEDEVNAFLLTKSPSCGEGAKANFDILDTDEEERDIFSLLWQNKGISCILSQLSTYQVLFGRKKCDAVAPIYIYKSDGIGRIF